MYKLIAVDLDGTLLNSYGEVTEYSKKIIKRIIDEGNKFIIASGRPMDSIKMIAKEIGSDEFFIAGNGALIYDIRKDKIIYEKYMSKQKCPTKYTWVLKSVVFSLIFKLNFIFKTKFKHS